MPIHQFTKWHLAVFKRVHYSKDHLSKSSTEGLNNHNLVKNVWSHYIKSNIYISQYFK